MPWLLLVLTLPTENTTARMRAWRTLKASGATVLRDGVYLLPARETCRVTLSEVADDIRANGGVAYLLEADGSDSTAFAMLFDRSMAYGELLSSIREQENGRGETGDGARFKQVRKLRRAFDQLVAIDFFPGEAQHQTAAALQELELAISRTQSPDEPQTARGSIPLRLIADYRGGLWATRARPRVDRLASAWLIRRFIDPDARVLWLASPSDCPSNALGFDFDGATFSHVDGKVTFETLLASFQLTSPGLARLASIVHFLDVGGIQPAEAQGVEQVLSGLHTTLLDDDALLDAACGVFDALLAAFAQEVAP